MKKFILIVIGIAFLSMTGCAQLWKTKKAPGHKFKQHGMASWYELMTTDVQGAKDFYGKLFGWNYQQDNTPGVPYTIAKVKGKQICGIFPNPEQAKNVPPYWGVYITVNDVDETAKLAQNIGGKVVYGPEDIPKIGRFCVIQDPQGAVISVITYSSPCSKK